MPMTPPSRPPLLPLLLLPAAAATLLLVACPARAGQAKAAPKAPVRLEAEGAKTVGGTVSRERAGFSGAGYVTDITAKDARTVWTLDAPAGEGVYEVWVGFATPSGPKGFDVAVNGRKTGGRFPDSGGKFARFRLGKVLLRAGANEIAVERGWGYYDLDYVEIAPAAPPAPLKAVPAALSTPKPSPEARRLMAYLTAGYGRRTLSGQYNHDDSAFVKTATGRAPAVLGGDFMDYSPSRLPFNPKPKDQTEKLVAAGRAGQIVTVSWHWNAPKDLLNRKYRNDRGEEVDASWYKGFYTNATTFDVSKAMADPASEERRLILRDIDAAAAELKKFQKARVPVLWRPLHEAEGGWFWWGAKGPEPCKWLWQLMHERLTTRHGLDNLIWVWNSADPAWYPGDATVDVVSIDSYPSDRTDPLVGPWESLLARFDGRKLLALAEFPGAPDVEGMRRLGVRWAFFVSWTGSLGPKGDKPEALRRTYASAATVTKDELPPSLFAGAARPAAPAEGKPRR